MRKPNAIWPCKASISFLSDNNFTIIIVDEKVNATAIYRLEMLSKPNARPRRYPPQRCEYNLT